MFMATSTQAPSSKFNIRDLLTDIILNAAVPFGLYTLTKHYISSSEVLAIGVASIFPLFYSIYDFVRHRSFDLIAILTLLGFLVGLVGFLLGGNPKILLIRESFLTVMLSITCFVSLLLKRPFMFYMGRQLMAGKDPVRIAEFNAQWQIPYIRFVHRLITSVWGVAYMSEFIVRVILVYTLPTALVLAISPLLMNGILIATITWTFAYVRYATRRQEEMKAAQAQVAAL